MSSTLGQGLTTSTFPGEVLFSIAVAILGLLLFALLIGNMQAYHLSCFSLLNLGLNLSRWMINLLKRFLATDVSSVSHSSAGRDEGQETRLGTMDASPGAPSGVEGKSTSLWSIQMDGNQRSRWGELGPELTQGPSERHQEASLSQFSQTSEYNLTFDMDWSWEIFVHDLIQVRSMFRSLFLQTWMIDCSMPSANASNQVYTRRTHSFFVKETRSMRCSSSSEAV